MEQFHVDDYASIRPQDHNSPLALESARLLNQDRNGKMLPASILEPRVNDGTARACVGTQVGLSFLGVMNAAFSLPSERCETQRAVMVTCAQADMHLRAVQSMTARGERSAASQYLVSQALPEASACLQSVDKLALFLEKERKQSQPQKPDYCKVFPTQSECRI